MERQTTSTLNLEVQGLTSITYPNEKSWLCYQTLFISFYIKVNIECKCISKQVDIDGISV